MLVDLNSNAVLSLRAEVDVLSRALDYVAWRLKCITVVWSW